MIPEYFCEKYKYLMIFASDEMVETFEEYVDKKLKNLYLT